MTYDGEGALPVRLVAARYDRGRLLRYGVSERTVLEAPGAALAIPERTSLAKRPLALNRLTYFSAI